MISFETPIKPKSQEKLRLKYSVWLPWISWDVRVSVEFSISLFYRNNVLDPWHVAVDVSEDNNTISQNTSGCPDITPCNSLPHMSGAAVTACQTEQRDQNFPPTWEFLNTWTKMNASIFDLQKGPRYNSVKASCTALTTPTSQSSLDRNFRTVAGRYKNLKNLFLSSLTGWMRQSHLSSALCAFSLTAKYRPSMKDER